MSQTNARPESVVGRYLTVGGATVDIRPVDDSDRDDCHEATCAGCGAKDWQRYYSRPVNDEAAARRWAQQHAETCRAMPRPA